MFVSLTARARRLKPSHELWTPHGYQERAVEFLLNRGSAALFLDPGLGKTSITLSAFDILRSEGVAKKMLVIAPLRVCQLVWRQEADRWTQFRHLKFTLLHGPKKKKLLDDDSDIFLINPEGIPWLVEQFWGKKFPFDTVVIDELTKFKNAQAVRHKALMPKMGKVQRRWGLTGTPIPNGYLDLFGQMKVLDDGASLGQWFSHYRDKYFEKDFTGFNYDLRRGGAKAIEKAIKPYVLRMSAEDYLEMPRLIEDIRPVVMPKKARVLYDQMKRDMLAELEDGDIEAGNAAAVYSKLKQMANGAVYAGDGVFEPRRTVELHSAKIEAIQELVEELAGTPLLVGYEFNHDLKRLRKALGNPPYIGSGVSGAQAAEIEKDWNAGRLPVLLAHPASAGHGLNLQKGNAFHIAWFSTTWDYELYDQFMRRIMRQGNASPVIFNHIFIVENSLDMKTKDVIENKGLTQSSFFDALNAEVYQTGKTGAPPKGAYSGTEKDEDMVRKLSRRAKAQEDVEDDIDEEEEDEEEQAPKRKSRRTSRRKARDEEPEDEDDAEDDEEDEAPKRKSRRAGGGTKRKLRGKAKEEPEDEDEDEDDAEDDAPVSKRARKRFSKGVQDKLDEDGDDAAEEEADEEPKPKKRRKSKKAAKPADDEAPFDADDDLLSVAEAALKTAIGTACADNVPGLVYAAIKLDERMKS